VAEFKEALKTYRAALLLVLEEPVANLERLQTDFPAELKLLDLAARLEKQAFLAGMYRAIGLVVGGCKLCDECTPLGEPCRHPYRARPSPEGLGIDLTALARRAGVAIEWPPATKVVFLGLLLV
jgi:predicted metal-binding protein